MYFKDRVDAGHQLAQKMAHYRGTSTAVVALSDGGVVVASQIASFLKCPVMLLILVPIKLPGEPNDIAVINQEGGITYNQWYSTGQLEDLTSEYYHFIEQTKRDKLNEINRLVGRGGLLRKDLLHDRNVILVSDGLNSGFLLDAAIDYLKPVRIKKIIIATPVASVASVDRMHVLSDEIQCLSVVANFMTTNHYYENNTLPSHFVIIKAIKGLMNSWRFKK